MGQVDQYDPHQLTIVHGVGIRLTELVDGRLTARSYYWAKVQLDLDRWLGCGQSDP